MNGGALRRPLYLRLSVTDGCAFRCPYCQPESPQGVTPAGHLLTPAEIARSVRALARVGATRVRLSGGEPLSRPDLEEIVGAIAGIESIYDVALTTNGERLAARAAPLARAGLRRVNVHLDSLRPQRFETLVGRPTLGRVLSGIAAAREAALAPIKINVVLMRGINDDELLDFCEFALKWRVTVRFIELMNTGPSPAFVKRHFFPAARARRRIAERYPLTPRFEDRGASPAREYRLDGVDGGAATVGFIASETEPFCESCNRIRLTAQGRLKLCLYDPGGLDVRGLLRDARVGEAHFQRALAQAVGGKRSHHPAFGQRGERAFSMAQVGG